MLYQKDVIETIIYFEVPPDQTRAAKMLQFRTALDQRSTMSRMIVAVILRNTPATYIYQGQEAWKRSNHLFLTKVRIKHQRALWQGSAPGFLLYLTPSWHGMLALVLD